MMSLTGHLLIAMPQMEDPFFARSAVFLLAHSEDSGAMGLMVNKTVESLTVDRLYADLEITPVIPSARPLAVHFGGPVAPGHAFVLHSADYREAETQIISGDFALTTSLDILRAMAKGTGPRQSLVTIGYAGWGPGQLEGEIGANGWLSVPADTGLVFDSDDQAKWQLALAKLGVSPEMISGETGRA
jgi:putative transcriptional regulator